MSVIALSGPGAPSKGIPRSRARGLGVGAETDSWLATNGTNAKKSTIQSPRAVRFELTVVFSVSRDERNLANAGSDYKGGPSYPANGYFNGKIQFQCFVRPFVGNQDWLSIFS